MNKIEIKNLLDLYASDDPANRKLARNIILNVNDFDFNTILNYISDAYREREINQQDI